MIKHIKKGFIACVCLVMLFLVIFQVPVRAENGSGPVRLDKPVLSSVSNAATGVQVQWEPVAGCPMYRLYRKDGDSAAWDCVADTADNSAIDTQAVSGVSYRYAVCCLGTDGKEISLLSGSKTITYIERPTLLGVSNSADGVAVKWTRVEGAVKYRLYRQNDGNSSWEKVLDTENTNAVDTGAVSGKKYRYAVRAINKAGNVCNTYSAWKSITYVARPKLSSVSNTSTGVSVKWKKVAGAVKYRLYRKDPSSGSWKKLIDVELNSAVDTAVQSGTEYAYAVRGINAAGNVCNSYSEPLSITYVERPVLSGISMSRTGVTIRWDAVTGAAHYRVYHKGPNDTDWVEVGVTSDTSLADTTVQSGNKYSFSVRCEDDASVLCSTYAASRSLTFIACPDGVSAAAAEGGIEFTWNPVGGAAWYRIYRKQPGDLDWTMICDRTTETAFLDQNVISGQAYIYSVRSMDGGGILRNERTESGEVICNAPVRIVYSNIYSLTLRKEKNETSESRIVPYMTALELLDNNYNPENGKWLSVTYQGENWYFWHKENAEIITAEKSNFAYDIQTIYQKEVLDLAMSFLEKPTGYQKVSEGSSTGIPDTDGTYWFDCSGFSSYVINLVMQKYVPTYRISYDVDRQYETEDLYNLGMEGAFSASTVIREGESLDTSLLQPGDLVFFYQKLEEDRKVDHVGIYLGNGEFIQATESFGINIAPLTRGYADSFVGALRVLPAEVIPAEKAMYVLNGANLYPEKDTDSKPLTLIEAQEEVTVQYTDSGRWAYAVYGDQSGYIPLDKLTEEAPENVDELRYIGKNSQKLYVSRSTSGDYITLEYGTPVQYRGRYGTSGYYRVMYENTQYYVYHSENNIDSILLPDTPWIQQDRYVLKMSCNLYPTRNAASGQASRTCQIGEKLIYHGRYGTTNFYRVTCQGESYYVYTTGDIDQILTADAGLIYTSAETRYTSGEIALRSSMTTQDDENIIKKLPVNSEVGLIKVSDSSTWAYVQCENDYGFVLAKYLVDSLPPQISETRYVRKCSVNLYYQKNAQQGQPSIACLIGEEVIYHGRSGTSNFYQITYQGEELWIYTKDNIDEVITTDLESVLSTQGWKTTTASVWMRSSMSTASDENKILKLQKGEEVGLVRVSSSGNWAYVRNADGVYGFIAAKYLEGEGL